MSSNSGTNYAAYAGIKSVPAAIVFAALYVPLLFWFIIREFRTPNHTFIVLALFSALRVGAYGLRAALAISDSLDYNTDVFTAYEVLFFAGFVAILYSAFKLAIDRQTLTGVDRTGGIWRIVKNKHLIRLVLAGAMALGITGLTKLTDGNADDETSGTNLRNAAVYIYLAVSCLLALLTIVTVIDERRGYRPEHESVVERNAPLFLVLIAALAVTREGFYAATLHHPATAANEDYFYPFMVLTEFLAVCVFAIPGVVPPASAIVSKEADVEAMYMGRR